MERPSKTTIAYVSWVYHDFVLLWRWYSHHDTGMSYENRFIVKSLCRPSLSLFSFFSLLSSLYKIFFLLLLSSTNFLLSSLSQSARNFFMMNTILFLLSHHLKLEDHVYLPDHLTIRDSQLENSSQFMLEI